MKATIPITVLSVTLGMLSLQAVEGADFSKTEQHSGFLVASEVTGKEVHNRSNEKVGTIERLLIDPQSGSVRFAIVSTGGFLGIAEKRSAIPWRVFDIRKVSEDGEDQEVHIFLDTTKEKLKNAPEYDPKKENDLFQPAQARPYFNYWEVTWTEPGEKPKTYSRTTDSNE